MDINPIYLLPEILKYARPDDSDTERRFCKRFIECLPGIEQDMHGNYYLEIGSNPNTMFSAHTDTVDCREGYKSVILDPLRQELFTDNGDCLGADDGTGIWIMLQMIHKQIPGMYVFHRGEEVGCIGSGWIADNKPDWLAKFNHAIAFDRAGTRDIITSQRDSQCASDAFAADLAARLWQTGYVKGNAYKPARGIYTDTAEYTHIIPECTNLSVGYERQHSSMETQCMRTLQQLMPALLTMDWKGITAERKPEPRTTYTFGRSYNNWDYWDNYAPYNDDDRKGTAKLLKPPAKTSASFEDIYAFVTMCPTAAANLLEDFEVTDEDMDYALDCVEPWLQDEDRDDASEYLGLTNANY